MFDSTQRSVRNLALPEAGLPDFSPREVALRRGAALLRSPSSSSATAIMSCARAFGAELTVEAG